MRAGSAVFMAFQTAFRWVGVCVCVKRARAAQVICMQEWPKKVQKVQKGANLAEGC